MKNIKFFLVLAMLVIGCQSNPLLPASNGSDNTITAMPSNKNDGLLPDTAKLVYPSNGYVYEQPLILKWRKVADAKKYWICISVDNWTTLTINDSTLVDTVLIVDNLPSNTVVRWNVATGNDQGWNTSSWQYAWWFVTAKVRGSISTQVLQQQGLSTTILTKTVIQVFDEGGIFFGNMVYGISGDLYSGYHRIIVPDISKKYLLRCLLVDTLTYSSLEGNQVQNLPQRLYPVINGNIYTVYPTDFKFRMSFAFNSPYYGVTIAAYPRQFWYKGTTLTSTSVGG
jgi:hypothetical protein